jgi:putative tryptophan/tyrosine transport system substrate-binding protein
MREPKGTSKVATIDRRAFVAGVILGVLAVPIVAETQQTAKLPRIGIVVDGHPAPPEERGRSPLAQGLRDLGWEAGKNVTLDVVYSEGKLERLTEGVADLVRRHVDVIWCGGPRAAVAAARATPTIPVVFWGVSAPLEVGLVDSLARPGRNVTGVAYTAGLEINSKLLELLKTAAPRTARVAQIYNPTSATDLRGESLDTLPTVLVPAKRLAVEVKRFNIRSDSELSGALADILNWRADSILVHGDPLTWTVRQRIIDFAHRNGLPSAFGIKDFALAGGLLAYSPDTDSAMRRSAAYLDKILRGAKPSDLPVEQPTKLELVINLKTAKALNLTIPPSLLLRADQVIE